MMAVSSTSPWPDSTQPCALKAKEFLVLANKPPPASWYRAVLLLCRDVLLFNISVNTSVHPKDIIISSRNSRRTMMVETVLINLVLVVKDMRYLELMVTFYPGQLQEPFQIELHKLIMAKDWTPRMYLGALNQSIMNNAVLSLEAVALDQKSYATTNKLHWLFSLPFGVINRSLTASAAYLVVAGSNYQSKSPWTFSHS
jgi:hypothetical protein